MAILQKVSITVNRAYITISGFSPISDDAMEREEDIHYAMLQREKHESVLLISGSPRSHLPEILKYDVRKVVYIERDPELAASARSETGGIADKLVIENEDAFRYIRDGGEKFDAIIMLLPPPSTLSLNRFYTTGVFQKCETEADSRGSFYVFARTK